MINVALINFEFYLQDTRTHVVVELYDTERSYVEALQILVNVSILLFLYIIKVEHKKIKVKLLSCKHLGYQIINLIKVSSSIH